MSAPGSIAAELAGFLALGVLGSLHCVGMCGGFALLAAGQPGAPALTRRLARQACYAGGKATSYALLALFLASGVAALEGSPSVAEARVGPLRTALSFLAGATLLGSGLATLGGARFPLGPLARPLAAATRPLRRLLVHADLLPPRARAFCVGVANGLLPCGLSWTALLLAARLAPPLAAAGAFAFGLATAPALAATVLSVDLVRGRWRPRVPALLGVALVLFGCASLARSARQALERPAQAEACCTMEAPG